MSVSVLILTYNEEVNLPACLKSASWTDDVLVFDSFSTDRTLDIARSAGARVIQRAFDNYGAQREAARMQGQFKYPWVLVLDADEMPDAELVAELRSIAAKEGSPDAYRMRRKDHFRGKWVRHATLYPCWFVRFFRHERVRYEARSVHEYPVVEGTVGELKGHLLHHSFNKGLEEWWKKHLRYAVLEAQESLKMRAGPCDWAGLTAFSDPVRRRRSMKILSTKLPMRPTLRFLYMYVLRRGFLDGFAGLTYCRMLAIYEYLIVLHMAEIEQRNRGLPV
jgi:glycosyltransferase involved in cell wall biosynthesis